jgi:hypothetical protein
MVAALPRPGGYYEALMDLASGLIGVLVGAIVASLARIAEAFTIGTLEERRRLRALLQRVLVEARQNRAMVTPDVLNIEGASAEDAYQHLERLLSRERMVTLDAWTEIARSALLLGEPVLRVLERGGDVAAFLANLRDVETPPERVQPSTSAHAMRALSLERVASRTSEGKRSRIRPANDRETAGNDE